MKIESKHSSSKSNIQTDFFFQTSEKGNELKWINDSESFKTAKEIEKTVLEKQISRLMMSRK